MNIIEETRAALEAVNSQSKLKAHSADAPAPGAGRVRSITDACLGALFPMYFSEKMSLDEICGAMIHQINLACSFAEVQIGMTPREAAEKFVASLPQVKAMLLKDIEALYEGDPAAKYRDEIILCYPGFFAIAVYRLAHVLYEMKVPLIYRIMTEYAHEKTGIDIHAGASIGEYFFIDHGTGIVIGETTVIGNKVKLYQGVTLGAKSFELDENGNPLKDFKRHPNIGDNVIIYANATILGGRTFIGSNSIIGANTWIIESVPEGSTIYYTKG